MKYIITDSVKNVNALIRRKNYAGTATHGIESRRAVSLAWELVTKYHSKSGIFKAHLINDNTAAAIVLSILKTKSLLIPTESLCMATAREVLACMNLMRANDYKAAEDERIKNLKELIDAYEEKLMTLNAYDETRVINEATKLLESGEVTPSKAEYEICYFDKVSQLEQCFVNLLNGGKTPDAFELRIPEENINYPYNHDGRYHFVSCYGIVNEADYVAKTIIEGKLPLGDVEIICDSRTYEPYIAESFAKRGLSCSFSSGISMAALDEVRLYKDLLSWYEKNCSYEDLKPVMLNNRYGFKYEKKDSATGKPETKFAPAATAFMKGISYEIGWGADRYLKPEKSSYDIKHDYPESDYQETFRTEVLPELGKLAKKLDLEAASGKASSFFDFLYEYVNQHISSRSAENKYTRPRLDNLRRNLASVDISFGSKEELIEFIYSELESLNYRQEKNAVCAIASNRSQVLVSERHHIFVIGLSSKEYDISVAESPVLGDELREKMFGTTHAGNVTFAKDNRDRADEILKKDFAYAPADAEIILVKSDADVMKDGSAVAASAFFDEMWKFCKEPSIQEETKYNEITTHSVKIDHKVFWPDFDVVWNDPSNPVKLRFSKSSLDDFLGCPVKYHYQKNLGINQEEYADYDPGKWLAPNEKGTLLHRAFELYAIAVLKGKSTGAFDQAEFDNAFNQAVKDMEREKPAPSAAVLASESKEYKDLAEIYLKWLHDDLKEGGWTVCECEYDIDSSKSGEYSFDWAGSGGKYDFGIEFSGSVDRIDKKTDENGETVYRIIDYKTGNNPDEKNPTKQHEIYAWYVRRAFKVGEKLAKVDRFDYQSLKEMTSKPKLLSLDESKLDDDFITPDEKEKLYDAFVLHNYLTGVKPDENKACRYCKYKDICAYKLLKEEK